MHIRSIRTHKGNILLILAEEVVVKKYSDYVKADKEYTWLKTLHGSKMTVPKPYHRIDDVVVREYIRGENLATLLSNLDSDGVVGFSKAFELLLPVVKWLETLKVKLGMVNGDPNLRNFIMRDDGKVFCVDLEDIGEGPIEKSLGFLCQNLLVLNIEIPIEDRVKLCKNLIAGNIGINVNLNHVWEWVEIGFNEKILLKPHLKEYFVERLEMFKKYLSSV